MRKLAIVLLILLALVGVYKINYPTYIWHQKMTLQVETPNGLKSGAAVVKVQVEHQPKLLPDVPSTISSLWGEAVVVDLGDGRYLFALLKDYKLLVLAAFAEQLPKGYASHNGWAYYIKRLKGVAAVPISNAPLLVTFADVSDPASVMLVDPADLAATFGEGYALREITLEITQDATTQGVIEGVLAWHNEYNENGYLLNGKTSLAYGVDGPLADRMDARAFKLENSGY